MHLGLSKHENTSSACQVLEAAGVAKALERRGVQVTAIRLPTWLLLLLFSSGATKLGRFLRWLQHPRVPHASGHVLLPACVMLDWGVCIVRSPQQQYVLAADAVQSAAETPGAFLSSSASIVTVHALLHALRPQTP